MSLVSTVASTNNVKASDDAITSSQSEHITIVREIDCTDRPGQVFDFEARLEGFAIAVTIEDFDLVTARATCNDKVMIVLLELTCENTAVLF